MTQDAEIIPPSSAPDPLKELVRTVEFEPPIDTEKHALRVLPSLETILAAIARDVETATRRVLVETYIYRADRLGQSFGDALARAAARGLDVRLIYDPLGSQETPPEFFDELRRRGVKVRAYRPKKIILEGGSLFPRDHSRVIAIDDHAYTGGAAWGDEWLPRRLGGMGWEDMCMQIAGPAVEDFSRLFEMRWREANGELDEAHDMIAGKNYPDLEILADSPANEDLVLSRYERAIREAKKRVWIANAYFFPPPGMLKDLYDATARGLDVQVILAGRTDLPIIAHAAHAEYEQWLNRGLKIYEFQSRTFHGKYAVFDDDLCTVGTMNANPTSMRLANELNVFVHDRVFVERLAKAFLEDRRSCTQVDRERITSRTLGEQVIDRLANDAVNLLDVFVGPRRSTS